MLEGRVSKVCHGDQSGSKVQTFIAAKWKVAMYQAHINGTVTTSGGVTKMTLTGKGCDGKVDCDIRQVDPAADARRQVCTRELVRCAHRQLGR